MLWILESLESVLDGLYTKVIKEERMFIPENTIKIGDKCITTKELENFAGKFTVGTVVKVTDIGDRGYNLVDDFGNEIIECGWNCVKKVESKSIKWGEISENG